MIYHNATLKIDQLVNYLNDKKINLSPAFQRGHVWPIGLRASLVKNIIAGKPIPAVFLYKEAEGAAASRYTYNILDGKQRLESIMLFIGDQRRDMSIKELHKYFADPKHRRAANFRVKIDGRRLKFGDLAVDRVRDFYEYVIPTIEIQLDDNTDLSDIISLFVDINQKGVQVKRFDVVKAMYKDNPLLRGAFRVIAVSEGRGNDVLYKLKNNEFTYVLKRLAAIEKTPDRTAQIDKIWERFLELSVFSINRTHKKPVDILKGFINKRAIQDLVLEPVHIRDLRRVFVFLKALYKTGRFENSKFAKDMAYFYTMTTSLIKGNLLVRHDQNVLIQKMIALANLIDRPTGALKARVQQFNDLCSKHTTDISRREQRETLFNDLVAAS